MVRAKGIHFYVEIVNVHLRLIEIPPVGLDALVLHGELPEGYADFLELQLDLVQVVFCDPGRRYGY